MKICVLALAMTSLLFVAISTDGQVLPDRVNVYATGGKSTQTRHGQAEIEAIHFEWGKALSPRTELVFVAAPQLIRQPRGAAWENIKGSERVRAISGSFMLRRRFMTESSTVQPYVELGSGPMWATRRVPAATSRFNFISQTGFGAVIYPTRTSALVIGYRFAHISNAGITSHNPGLDVSSLLIGVQVNPMRRR